MTKVFLPATCCHGFFVCVFNHFHWSNDRFKIAQQDPHKREPAFQTRELMLKYCGSSPPNQLKKYLSPWSAKGRSREYQSNEKQHGYEIEMATPCKKSKEKLGMQGWSPAGVLTSGWQNGPACEGLNNNTGDLHLCYHSVAAAG